MPPTADLRSRSLCIPINWSSILYTDDLTPPCPRPAALATRRTDHLGRVGASRHAGRGQHDVGHLAARAPHPARSHQQAMADGLRSGIPPQPQSSRAAGTRPRPGQPSETAARCVVHRDDQDWLLACRASWPGTEQAGQGRLVLHLTLPLIDCKPADRMTTTGADVSKCSGHRRCR